MARVSRSEWIDHVVSQYGPDQERDRHLCHALSHLMRGDGTEGCYPGQRYLATMIGSTHRTVAKSLDRLRQAGWVHTAARRRQFGKKGAIYYPAVPHEVLQRIGESRSPIDNGNGESKPPQFAPTMHKLAKSVDGLVDKLSTNGEYGHGNGESARRIGESRLPRNLTETRLNGGAASPSPADARDAAPRKAVL